MCVLVIGCTSPRLHLEKILIFSSILLNHKQPIGWHGCAFQTAHLAGWMSAEEKAKSLKPLSVFQPESRRKVSSQLEVWAVWAGAYAESEEDRVGKRCHKSLTTEGRGWSRIEPRILDSRVPQKASIRARTASALISTDASLGCRECRRVDCISFLPCSTARRGVHGHGEKGGACCQEVSEDSLQTDRVGSANQGACRPLCSCSGLFLYPHSSVCCVHSLLLSEPKLLLFHGVSFQRLVFCLMKSWVT